MAKLVDLTEQRFGKWVVLSRAASRHNRGTYWHCLCDCGTVREVHSHALKHGQSTDCGCGKIKHGHAKKRQQTAEFKTWVGMKRRCLNPRIKGFSDYGGRGITVCNEWRDSFAQFYADMGPRPTAEHSLDRYPDTNGPYSKTNCRWATRKEQARNKRNNTLLTYGGQTLTVAEWSETLSIPYTRIIRRMRRGYAIHEILSPKYRPKPLNRSN